MIYVLFGLITVLMLLTIIIFDRDITSPAFLLTAAFWAATFCACLYSKNWGFSNNILLAEVLSGLCGFILFSGIKYRYTLLKIRRKPTIRPLIPISIADIKLIFYLLIQLALYSFSLITMLRNVGSGLNLSSLIGTYYALNHAGNVSYSSSIINIGSILNFSGTYYVLYVGINNLLCKKKNKILLWINALVGMFGSLLTGTKTAFYMFIIGIFVISIILHNKKVGWKKNITLKTMVKVSIILMALLVSFSVIDNLQGRTLRDVTAIDKIAIYLGAPLKNLELFITDNSDSNQIFGAQTFFNTYADLYEISGNSRFKIISLHTYRWIGKTGLGNVYTIFMPLYYDFGISGTFVVMGVLGWLFQHMYNKLKYDKRQYDIDFQTMFYGYVAFAITFSFFSNKIFEAVISKTGIYFLIGMIFFDLFFIRLHLKGLKLKIKKEVLFIKFSSYLSN